MTQLDALRFFAVFGVIVAHNWKPAPLPSILAELDFGDLGVRLFFVLSGFLITGILLRGARPDEPLGRRLHAMRQFYIRRFLRIFPVYYLALALCLIFAVEPARQLWPWLFTYTTNVYVWQHAVFIPNLGHFWTLAVEEQFYVVWPVIVLFAPRRRLLGVLTLVIASALAYRLYASYRYPIDITGGESATLTLIFGVVDCLGIGALLALCTDADAGRAEIAVRRLLRGLALPAGLALYVGALVLVHRHAGSHIGVTVGPFGEALMFCWLIDRAARGFGGAGGRILEFGPLVYLGTITYGIYIFHNLVPVVFDAIAGALGVSYSDQGFPNFVVTGVTTIAIAALSWHVFEAPINRLKRYFPMPRRAERAAQTAPSQPLGDSGRPGSPPAGNRILP
jgi:peptidoglycan/LPS O-acetylase OafA/YrhL